MSPSGGPRFEVLEHALDHLDAPSAYPTMNPQAKWPC